MGLQILSLLFLLTALPLIGQVADLLRSSIELAQFPFGIDFFADCFRGRCPDLLRVTDEAFCFIVPTLPGVLPEFYRAAHFTPAVRHGHAVHIGLRRRHVVLSLKRRDILHFKLEAISLVLHFRAFG